MIEKSVVDHGIDRRRIFITGLSAGGAMTSVMLACYPELFAGGAIIAGCFKVPAVRRRNGVSWYAKRRLIEAHGHASRCGMGMPTRQ
jgi:poly(3-hydroxybutyrate) depolymerase